MGTIPLNPPFDYAVPERSRRAGQALSKGDFENIISHGIIDLISSSIIN